MLFECLVIFALAGALGLMSVMCYRQGLRDGKAMGTGQELGPVLQLDAKAPGLRVRHHVRAHGKAPEADPEQERYDVMLANIEAYAGDGVGQREVPL